MEGEPLIIAIFYEKILTEVDVVMEWALQGIPESWDYTSSYLSSDQRHGSLECS